MSSSKWQWIKVLDTTLWTHQFFQIFALRESNMAMENILFIGDYPSETPISSGFPASRVWLPQGTHSCWWISHSFWQVILSFVTKIIPLEFYTLKAYPNIFTHHIPNWETVLEYIYSIRDRDSMGYQCWIYASHLTQSYPHPSNHDSHAQFCPSTFWNSSYLSQKVFKKNESWCSWLKDHFQPQSQDLNP